MKEEGINITLTKTYEDQINIGESLEGYEIKFDDKYKETGNLWIEIKERTDVNKEYVNSGIYRDDNSKYYVIGNYDVIFVFLKDKLKQIEKQKNKLENDRKTSIGYLLTTPECFRYSNMIINCKEVELGINNWM